MSRPAPARRRRALPAVSVAALATALLVPLAAPAAQAGTVKSVAGRHVHITGNRSLVGYTYKITQASKWTLKQAYVKKGTLRWQWYRNSTPIKGATSLTYKTRTADAGKTIRLRATGKAAVKGHPSFTRTSQGVRITGVLKPKKLPSFKIKKGFTLRCSAPGRHVDADLTKYYGHTVYKKYAKKYVAPKYFSTKNKSKLVAKAPTWNTSGVKNHYQWYRWNTPIKGATSKTYTVRKADRTHNLVVKVTGTKKGWTMSSGFKKAHGVRPFGTYCPKDQDGTPGEGGWTDWTRRAGDKH